MGTASKIGISKDGLLYQDLISNTNELTPNIILVKMEMNQLAISTFQDGDTWEQ